MHTCINEFMHLYRLVCMNTCIHAYMHICIYVYMHTCIYAYMYTCITSTKLSRDESNDESDQTIQMKVKII